MEATELEADLAPPQESQAIMASTRLAQSCLVWEAIAWVMAKTGTMINVTMEAIKSGRASTPDPGP